MRVENSFIPVEGIGEQTERQLWRQGILEWDAFEPSVLGGTRGDRVARYIETAREHLATGDSAFFATTFPDRTHWRLYETFRSDACYLDIETTGLDQQVHEVTVVSTHQGGETTTLVKDDDLTRGRLREELEAASLLVTFNGKRFDVPFLEGAFDLSIDVPHLDLMYPCRRIGLTGGLKTIERTLEIDRGEDDIGGRDAIRLWREYQRGDGQSLAKLIDYNRDDTVNLVDVADEIVQRLDEAVFGEAIQHRQTRLR